MVQAPHLAQGELGVDHNFGCAVREGDLRQMTGRPWRGMNGVVRGNLKLWKRASALGPRDAGKCTNLPPMSTFVKSAGQGGVSEADLVVITEDRSVFRVYAKGQFCWSDLEPAKKWGNWWTFTLPASFIVPPLSVSAVVEA